MDAATVSLGELTALLDEVEREDPIDFADLPFDENDLKQLVLISLAEREQAFAQSEPDPQARLAAYLAATARLVLENLVLNARLLRQLPGAH